MSAETTEFLIIRLQRRAFWAIHNFSDDYFAQFARILPNQNPDNSLSCSSFQFHIHQIDGISADHNLKHSGFDDALHFPIVKR